MIARLFNQNVHKNHKWTDHLLETLSDSTDIIFLQEPPRYQVKDLPSGLSKDGEAEFDTCHHPRWSKVFLHHNVSVYVNLSLLSSYDFFLLPEIDANIIVFVLQLRATGERFHFINVYVDPMRDTLSKLLSFLDRFDSTNLFLAGDFNLHSPQWDVNVLHADPKAVALFDQSAISGLFLLNEHNCPTWSQPGKTPSVIDLVFVHGSLLERFSPILDVSLDDRGAGDHAAMFIRFFDTPPIHELRKALPRGSLARKAFLEDASNAWKTVDLDDLPALFSKLSDSFDTHSVLVQSKKRQGWWNQACTDAKQAFRSSRSDVDKATWYRTMKRARTTFFNRKVAEAADSDDIWGLLKWKQPRPAPKYIQLLDSQGSPLQDMPQVFDTLHQQFTKMADIPLASPSYARSTPRQWCSTTSQDLLDALGPTSAKSAPGPDQLGWDILKQLAQEPDVLGNMTKVVDRIIFGGAWPQALKESLTVVIPKPNKTDFTVAKNYRPIALLNAFAKLVTKVLACKMQNDARINSLLHPFQMGGIQKRSTLDAAACLMHKVTTACDEGLFTTALAVDISQFFPSLRHDVLVETLMFQGFPGDVVSSIQAWLHARTTIYALGASRSQSYPLDSGVPQGDPLSPLLSALYFFFFFFFFFFCEPKWH
jgi:hypothetical protein